MKIFLKTLLFSVVLTLAISPPTVEAQTTTTRANLASALAAGSQNTLVCLNSTTGISGSTTSNQYFGYMQGEQVSIRSVNTTSNCLTVVRARNGNAAAHPANEIFWFGGPGSWSPNTTNIGGAGVTNPVTTGSALPAVFVPTTPYGTCTRANNAYLPVINPNNGDIVDCILSSTNTTSEWVTINNQQLAYTMPYKKLKSTGCAAGDQCTTYTALFVDHTIGYVTTGNGTITIPAITGAPDKNYRIQIETTGTQSVTIATSSGQLINGAASIVIGGSTSFGGATIYSDGGTNWFTPK